jgi:hypothetical protein
VKGLWGVDRPSFWLVTDATWAVVTASLRIRLQRFDRVAAWATAGKNALSTDNSSESPAVVVRAIHACCRRMPWRTLCMEQALAGARLLKKRGYAVELHYGVALREGELLAHVWLRSADLDVLGCDIADQFVDLARFSA